MTQPRIRNSFGALQNSSSLVGIPRGATVVKFSSALTLVLLTTNQTYVIPPNTYNSVEVEAWGAGGGGTNNFSYGGGGSSGAMCAKTFACSTGLSIAATIGAGGGQGVAGGATTFAVNGVTYTANGGNQGALAGTTGGAAPTATGGDVNNSGRAGGNGDGATNAGGGGGAPASRRITRGTDGQGNGAGAGGSGPAMMVRYTAASVVNNFLTPPSDALGLGFTNSVWSGSGYGGTPGFPAGGGGGNQNPSNGGAGGANGAILLWLYA